MAQATTGQRLRDYLTSHGVSSGTGVSEDRIADFEQRHNVRFPEDLRQCFATMNGTEGNYGFGIIRFSNLDEIKSVAEEVSCATPPNAAVIQAAYREPIEGAAQYFVIADFLHESQLYAIYLSSSRNDSNPVILLDGSTPIRVAESFSEFVELYITSPQRLRLLVD